MVTFSTVINLGSKILKPTAYLNEKSRGDNSMLTKGSEIITRIIKRFSEVNDVGIKLDCLKVRSRLAPSSQVSYREYRILEKIS